MRRLLTNSAYFFGTLILVVTAVLAWHEWPRAVVTHGSQRLVADFSRPDPGQDPGEGEFVTTGRLIHHQQCGTGIFAMSVLSQDGLTQARRDVPVKIPQGARLTFDLYIPPPLLKKPLSKVAFDIFLIDSAGAEQPVFHYNYRQDWIDFVLNDIRESWQVDYDFIDRFRHFDLDLSALTGKEGVLSFRAQGKVSATKRAMRIYKKRAGSKFHYGITYLSPRLWEASKRSEKDFNVVVCVIDGLRSDALSMYGYEKQTTPFIASLAEKGVLFEDAYAPSNATRNSITALFTGRYPSLAGLPMGRWALTPFEKAAARALTTSDGPGAPSLPVFLAQKGYATGFTGSNPFILPGNKIGADLGFAEMESLNQKKYDTEGITKRALRFLDENAERPFLLYIHLNNGHGPYDPPKKFARQFARSEGEDQPPWPELYDGEMAYADTKVREISERIESLGIADNTLFIITADHGKTFETGRPKGHAHSLYESESKVPLIFYEPGRLPAGQKVRGLVSLLDIYPTIVAMGGDKIVKGLNGKDLLDAIASGVSERDSQYFEGAQIMALRTPDLKMVVKLAPYEHMMGDKSVDNGRYLEFYDLKTDPGEKVNLAGSGFVEENNLLGKMFLNKKILALERTRQIEALIPIIGKSAESLYPSRAREWFQLELAAGSTDRVFEVFLSTKRFLGSFLAMGFDSGDLLTEGTDEKSLEAKAVVKKGQSKTLSFTPFAPDDPYRLEIFVDGERLNPSLIRLGPYMLPYQENPGVYDKPRDIRLLTTDEKPEFDKDFDFGAYLWRWNFAKYDESAMGNQVRDALRSWGYVK